MTCKDFLSRLSFAKYCYSPLLLLLLLAPQNAARHRRETCIDRRLTSSCRAANVFSSFVPKSRASTRLEWLDLSIFDDDDDATPFLLSSSSLLFLLFIRCSPIADLLHSAAKRLRCLLLFSSGSRAALELLCMRE